MSENTNVIIPDKQKEYKRLNVELQRLEGLFIAKKVELQKVEMEYQVVINAIRRLEQ
jgi:GTP-sensing pleiotropic transcriptional regulator CodY